MISEKQVWLCATLFVLLSACAQAAPEPTQTQPSATPPAAKQNPSATIEPSSTAMPFELSSPAFAPGSSIPARFACTGEDLSPELRWGDPPAGTQSFALIFDDPDAAGGFWVHWVAYNLPAKTRGLPEGVPAGETIGGAGLQGANGWGRLEYGGPCPPAGSTHRYVFILYGLDTALDLESGASKQELLAAMQGHILAQTELAASFTR